MTEIFLRPLRNLKKIKSKIFHEANKVTTRKRRFVESGYKKISEVYFMDDNLLGKSNKKKFYLILKKRQVNLM